MDFRRGEDPAVCLETTITVSCPVEPCAKQRCAVPQSQSKRGMRQPKAAVLIDGKGIGSIFYLCQAEKCEVHNRVANKANQPTTSKSPRHKQSK